MKRIPLSGKGGAGKFALVDDRDYDRVIRFSTKWRLNRKSKLEYARTVVSIDNGGEQIQMTVLMHRLILGSLPGQVTHHHNDDGLDNRRENLCTCSHAENIRRQRMQRDRSSKFRGVSWDKKTKKWRVCIGLNGQRKYLGYFTSEINAALTYNKAAKELFGKWARLNDVRGRRGSVG